MVGNKGQVIGLDHMNELVQKSAENIKKNHFELLDSKRIEFFVTDGRQGTVEYFPIFPIKELVVKRG